MKFESGQDMLDVIQSGIDLYQPETETYVFLYNDKGSICYYDWISEDKADELSADAKTHDTYWGAFLGAGGFICEDGEELEWCNEHYKGEWIDTDE